MTYSRCRTSCSLSWLALFQKSCQLWALRFDINCILTCMQGLKLAKWNGSELNLEHTSPALREHGEGKMHGRNFCTGRGPPHGITKNERSWNLKVDGLPHVKPKPGLGEGLVQQNLGWFQLPTWNQFFLPKIHDSLCTTRLTCSWPIEYKCVQIQGICQIDHLIWNFSSAPKKQIFQQTHSRLVTQNNTEIQPQIICRV